MDTTRRAILRGMAAAPVVAAAGGLLVPESAMAAQAESPLILEYDPAETGAHVQGIRWLTRRFGKYDAAEISLARAWGVTKLSPAEVPSWPARSPEPAFAFGWSPNDPDANTKGKWHPQGVTTYYDAMGRNRKRMMVSWYDQSSADNGARIAVIDRSGSDPRYHYVALVKAVKSGSGYAAEPISGLHAGGLAWYRNRLYVTDSKNGALLVFNTDELFKFGGATPYAMPLSRTYQADDDSKARLKFSQVSVDRTSLQGPFRRATLIVNEWVPDKKPQLVGRWSFAYGSGSLLLSDRTRAQSSSVYRVERGSGLPGGTGIQGAVAIGNTLYLSVSDGANEGYFSAVALNREGVGTAVTKWRVPRGPEDLSYEDRPGRGGWVWGLGEYVGNRHVYAMPV
ncbi:hypothetical protein ACH492_01845 [Streptomyces sp. NPDC019443]|uniref:hypothetical protein n=1 Tax=Streptomyces sp. NPDC019443 TaxID=3365061 RepID=UPI0037BB667D